MTAQEVLYKAENSPELSPSLSQTIASASRIMIAAGPQTNRDLAAKVVSLCGDKLKTVLSEENIAGAENLAQKIDKTKTEDFIFFGSTRYNVPALFHKSLLEHDAVIVLADGGYDSVTGFRGASSVLFHSLASEKSESALIKVFLDYAETGGCPSARSGFAGENPAYCAVRDAIMAASARKDWFAVNTVSHRGSIFAATAGDMFLSDISAQKLYDEAFNKFLRKPFDGLILRTEAKSLEEAAAEIERAAFGLIKGGRMFIDGKSLRSFGGSLFKSLFYEASLEDIFEKARRTGSKEALSAWVLKKLSLTYHIAINSALESSSVIQAGLNPLGEDLLEDFLKNCVNIGDIHNAARFTIQQ